MVYKVIIMPPAERRLDGYIAYTILQLKNLQAAKAILNDAKSTKKRLSKVADSISLCENPILAEHGYRKIRYRRTIPCS